MRLSKRLEHIAGLVDEGSRLVDVGTDHGYVPIYLVSRGVCPSAIAMDIREGPLKRAKANIVRSGLEEKIQVRLSDGLFKLAPGEADCMVAAGMGGALMIHILEQSRDIVCKMRVCILQPQSEISKVRKYLWEHQFYIEKEDMVCEDGKFYPMLRVLPGREQGIKQDVSGQSGRYILSESSGRQKLGEQELYELYAQFGKFLLENKHPVLAQFLEKEQQLNQKILGQLEPKLPGTAVRIKELRERSHVLQQAMEFVREDRCYEMPADHRIN